MEGRDSGQSPGLSSHTLFAIPYDGFMVGSEDEIPPRPNLNAVSAKLVEVKKERLANGVFRRPCFNGDTRFGQDVGRAQNILTTIHHVGHVMEAAMRMASVLGKSEVVRFVGCRQPRANLLTIFKDNLFRNPHSQQLTEKYPAVLDVLCEQVEVIQALWSLLRNSVSDEVV